MGVRIVGRAGCFGTTSVLAKKAGSQSAAWTKTRSIPREEPESELLT